MSKYAWRAVEAAKIAACRQFTVITFLGATERRRAEFTTLAEAQTYRASLPRDPYGRGSMVYAVTAAGETICVG